MQVAAKMLQVMSSTKSIASLCIERILGLARHSMVDMRREGGSTTGEGHASVGTSHTKGSCLADDTARTLQAPSISYQG